ncbi:MAG: prolipoprotein diacylglyceryl transferase [Oscillospiraceae bacterium]|nr:prolipoprotein diacylglyceryl transferase [Oscillospiraceae bacterium]
MLTYTTISFPSLGIEWNPGSSFSIGPLSFHYYGIIIAAGLLLAVLYAWKRCREFGIRQDDITDGVLWIVPLAIVCARLYYCIFKWEDYAADPVSILYIWNGGLAIYGGVIGAAIGVVMHCKIKHIKLPALLDLVALGFLIGQCIGRWGNFFNREAFGAETDSFLRMGLYNTATGLVEYHHPTFLYESLWNLVGFILLHFLSKKRRYDGQIALGYVAWYGLGRAVIEGLRTDSLYLGNFRVSQLLAAVSCFAAAVVLMVNVFRKHDPQTLFVNQVAARSAADQTAEEAGEEAEEHEDDENPEAPEDPENPEDSEDGDISGEE